MKDPLRIAHINFRDLLLKVEALGAHPLLTDVVCLLTNARDKLQEWQDAGRPGEIIHFNHLAPEPSASQLNPNCITQDDLPTERAELARTLMEWRDSGGPVEEVVHAIEEMICVRGVSLSSPYVRDNSKLPRFYTERKCSQCGEQDEFIAKNGCPERCGRRAEVAAQSGDSSELLVVICAECSMRNWNDADVCGLCEKPLNGQLVAPWPREILSRKRRDMKESGK